MSLFILIQADFKDSGVIYDIFPITEPKEDILLYDERFYGPNIDGNAEKDLLREWVKRYHHYTFVKRGGGRGFNNSDDNDKRTDLVNEGNKSSLITNTENHQLSLNKKNKFNHIKIKKGGSRQFDRYQKRIPRFYKTSTSANIRRRLLFSFN
uniref:Uncharacterized protein n=1 Tax=Parastrongyloides trichosuri TaxID=131310 RepID=A0A0N4ZEZ5_PARTI